ncbi:MAG: GtrA family protein, partial [Proteobacteria bacterium]|nr:GtrA family protein [Pseudomonadota bacterium]
PSPRESRRGSEPRRTGARGKSLSMLRLFPRAPVRRGSDPRLLSLGEGSLFRNITAAGIATAFDFGVVYSLVAATWLGPEAATLCGCAVGGVVNFTINRVWAFGAPGPYLSQGARYTFVSVSSALLNAGGVAVFLLLPNMDYRIAWVIARSAVFITWNYPLHRDFVFVQYRATIAKLDPGRARRDYRWERARRDAA